MRAWTLASAMVLLPFARNSQACDPWVNNRVYAVGERITYNGSGYEAAREVPLNTPPNPADNEWFWKATTACQTVQAPTGLSYASNPAQYSVGRSITPNTPSHTGGAPSRYRVAPSLPAGLSLDTLTGVIRGTPSSLSAAADYVVTASNSAGSAADTLRLAVVDSVAPPSGLSYAVDSAVYPERKAITPNAPSVTGTVTRYAIHPTLPAGLRLDSGTGVISGTPSRPANAADYVVSAQNAGGSTTCTLRIAVTLAAPEGLRYPENPAVYRTMEAANPNIPEVTGTVNNFSVEPALPTGLILDETTGMIWGTPTSVAQVRDYTVTASNPAGTTTVVLRLEVVSSVVIAPLSRIGRSGKASGFYSPAGRRLPVARPNFPALPIR